MTFPFQRVPRLTFEIRDGRAVPFAAVLAFAILYQRPPDEDTLFRGGFACGFAAACLPIKAFWRGWLACLSTPRYRVEIQEVARFCQRWHLQYVGRQFANVGIWCRFCRFANVGSRLFFRFCQRQPHHWRRAFPVGSSSSLPVGTASGNSSISLRGASIDDGIACSASSLLSRRDEMAKTIRAKPISRNARIAAQSATPLENAISNLAASAAPSLSSRAIRRLVAFPASAMPRSYFSICAALYESTPILCAPLWTRYAAFMATQR